MNTFISFIFGLRVLVMKFQDINKNKNLILDTNVPFGFRLKKQNE